MTTLEKPALTEEGRLEVVLDALEAHAAQSIESSNHNLIYAENVRRRSEELRTLILGKTGIVEGVAISWIDEIRPLAELFFDIELDGQELGAYRKFRPTAFRGIYARTKILSSDEVFGPTISLDIAAQEAYIPGA